VNIATPQLLHAKTRSPLPGVSITIRTTTIGSTHVGHDGAHRTLGVAAGTNTPASILTVRRLLLWLCLRRRAAHIAIEVHDSSIEPL
jgi:hypothetical protein